MLYLILSIASSTGNHILFKGFKRWDINLLCAIVTNYAVCGLIGYASSQELAFHVSLPRQDWFPFAILQGSIFVVCYFLMGWTTQQQGVAVASLATRLSVVIPTIAAFLLYDDLLTPWKALGILAALVALYLSSVDRPSFSLPRFDPNQILPIALFAGFGAHFTLSKYVQEHYLGDVSYHSYVMSAFLMAFLVSAMVLFWRLLAGKTVYRWRDLTAGVFLGCVNYGSVYFIIRTLSVVGWQSSQVFPTVSIAVVISSSLGAYAFFQERIHGLKIVALAIGLGSIILINI